MKIICKYLNKTLAKENGVFFKKSDIDFENPKFGDINGDIFMSNMTYEAIMLKLYCSAFTLRIAASEKNIDSIGFDGRQI